MIRIQWIQAKEILKVTEEGEVDLARAREYLRQIEASAPASEDYVILLDARQRILKMSITDIWTIAEALKEHGKTFRRRSALLVRPEDMEMAKLLELFSVNRGFLVNAFSSYEDAANWLIPPSETGKMPMALAA